MGLLDMFGDTDPGPGETLLTDLALVLFNLNTRPTKLPKVGKLIHKVGITQMQRHARHGVENAGTQLTLVLTAIEPFFHCLVACGRLTKEGRQDLWVMGRHWKGGQLEQGELGLNSRQGCVTD